MMFIISAANSDRICIRITGDATQEPFLSCNGSAAEGLTFSAYDVKVITSLGAVCRCNRCVKSTTSTGETNLK